MGTRNIAPADDLWLRMDTPTNLMVIESMIWLSGALDEDRAYEVLNRRLVQRYPVFSQ